MTYTSTKNEAVSSANRVATVSVRSQTLPGVQRLRTKFACPESARSGRKRIFMTKPFKYTLATLITALLGSIAGTALAQKSKTHRNASGAWRLDVTKSEFGDAPKPKSANVTIVVKGKKLSWTSDVARSDGNRVRTFLMARLMAKSIQYGACRTRVPSM